MELYNAKGEMDLYLPPQPNPGPSILWSKIEQVFDDFTIQMVRELPQIVSALEGDRIVKIRTQNIGDKLSALKVKIVSVFVQVGCIDFSIIIPLIYFRERAGGKETKIELITYSGKKGMIEFPPCDLITKGGRFVGVNALAERMISSLYDGKTMEQQGFSYKFLNSQSPEVGAGAAGPAPGSLDKMRILVLTANLGIGEAHFPLHAQRYKKLNLTRFLGRLRDGTMHTQLNDFFEANRSGIKHTPKNRQVLQALYNMYGWE